LVGVFLAAVITMLVQGLNPALRRYTMALIFIFLVAFFLLGITLIVLTLMQKAGAPQGWLKKFLLLTGVSAVGFFVFGLLHNAVNALFGVEDAFFFILAIIVCPPGFFGWCDRYHGAS